MASAGTIRAAGPQSHPSAVPPQHLLENVDRAQATQATTHTSTATTVSAVCTAPLCEGVPGATCHLHLTYAAAAPLTGHTRPIRPHTLQLHSQVCPHLIRCCTSYYCCRRCLPCLRSAGYICVMMLLAAHAPQFTTPGSQAGATTGLPRPAPPGGLSTLSTSSSPGPQHPPHESNAPRSATLAMNSRYRWSTEAGVSALAPPAPPAPPGAALRGARPKPLPASARCAARCGCLGLAGAVSRLTRRAAGTCRGGASWG